MFIKGKQQLQALIALLLIVPVSSIGATMSLFIAPGIVGQIVLIGCGIWMLIFPIAWYGWIDRGSLKLTEPKRYSFLLGTILGVLMFGGILAIYWFLGRYWLNIAEIRVKARQIGLSGQTLFLMAGTYFTLINSLVEEYVWRWFVYSKCEVLVSRNIAVWLSSLFFTLHHIIVLTAYSNDWRVVGLGTLAVFIAGVLWSRCYQVYRSILPGYISHVAADSALQIVAWNVLFG